MNTYYKIEQFVALLGGKFTKTSPRRLFWVQKKHAPSAPPPLGYGPGFHFLNGWKIVKKLLIHKDKAKGY